MADEKKAAPAASSSDPAVRQGNDGQTDPLKESLPKPDPGTPRKPEASANPDEVLGPSSDEPNYLNTTGLTVAQSARVNGTPLDGTHGRATLGGAYQEPPDRGARFAAATRADAQQRADKERAAAKKD
jgi:hypothetical protein